MIITYDCTFFKFNFQFLITAKNICGKLRKSGYWADFVNPFSGRPYLVPNGLNELYKADEKFRCLDFQIFEIDECKVICNEGLLSKRFIGLCWFGNKSSFDLQC